MAMICREKYWPASFWGFNPSPAPDRSRGLAGQGTYAAHPALQAAGTVSDKAIRHLVNRVNLPELLLLAEADLRGRGRERDFAAIRQWLLGRVAPAGTKA